MYWIYMAMFVGAVYVPSLIKSGYLGLNTIQTQELAILLLGSIGMILFNVYETRCDRQKIEKVKFQRQVSRMSKELNHSYSYIGEINRKLDILEHISQGFPETSQLTAKKKMEIYDSIMMAIGLFSKSDEFVLRFVSIRDGAIIKEIKSKPGMPVNFPQKVSMFQKNPVETEEYICTSSPKSIDNVFASIIIKKKRSMHAIEDMEIMRTLAAQALFLFMFIQKTRHLHGSQE